MHKIFSIVLCTYTYGILMLLLPTTLPKRESRTGSGEWANELASHEKHRLSLAIHGFMDLERFRYGDLPTLLYMPDFVTRDQEERLVKNVCFLMTFLPVRRRTVCCTIVCRNVPSSHGIIEHAVPFQLIDSFKINYCSLNFRFIRHPSLNGSMSLADECRTGVSTLWSSVRSNDW